uniref:Uncharacterized protein n=1 Tax=Candidatus Kentrum eta TaxID=2126337 RepID=A0A450U5H7_9GAMM|nr:MAG: hypothetical protein BECKH772A_GA0070896_1000156 [Candidatus Kentron sp. H]VFJ88289.1 MAG: hypothetical protein BECKH772B_GA0070898_1000148 [Candidatus Kentron sp. H]VFJ95507.1 MAG: hypothetical protein BECKH772C_GA0070978_1000256 [Candidatus Kentron sp. H]
MGHGTRVRFHGALWRGHWAPGLAASAHIPAGLVFHGGFRGRVRVEGPPKPGEDRRGGGNGGGYFSDSPLSIQSYFVT